MTKWLLLAGLIFDAGLALASGDAGLGPETSLKKQPACTLDKQIQLMIESVQKREGIECLSDQLYLICQSTLGPAYLDLRKEKDNLVAEGYWPAPPDAPAVAWISIEIRTKVTGDSCSLVDYSFNAAKED